MMNIDLTPYIDARGMVRIDDILRDHGFIDAEEVLDPRTNKEILLKDVLFSLLSSLILFNVVPTLLLYSFTKNNIKKVII